MLEMPSMSDDNYYSDIYSTNAFKYPSWIAELKPVQGPPLSKKSLFFLKIKLFIYSFFSIFGHKGNFFVNQDGTVDFDCSVFIATKSKKLPFNFGVVKGNFFVSGKNLTSMDGFPSIVYGSLSCAPGKIKDISSAPLAVGNSFSISKQKINDVSGLKTFIGSSLILDDNQIQSLDLSSLNIVDLNPSELIKNKAKNKNKVFSFLNNGFYLSAHNCGIEEVVGLPANSYSTTFSFSNNNLHIQDIKIDWQDLYSRFSVMVLSNNYLGLPDDRPPSLSDVDFIENKDTALAMLKVIVGTTLQRTSAAAAAISAERLLNVVDKSKLDETKKARKII